MNAAETSAESLKSHIIATESRLADLRAQLSRLEESAQNAEVTTDENLKTNNARTDENSRKPTEWNWPLSAEEYKRYGRQMIVPSFGLQGQLRIKKASVLIIGVGGLGCPAAAYLAGSGVGTLGLVDGDNVEISNLHRQVLHTTSRVGKSKVASAIESLQQINPLVKYIPHPSYLSPSNALAIVAPYDVVLDCTDRPTSRYLVSDVCVLLRKPLVSASALRTDGQLCVLNHPPSPLPREGGSGSGGGGPCYRCIFPRPPPAASVLGCGEGGILGPVVGVMGVLQALEALKLVAAGSVDDSVGYGGGGGVAGPSRTSAGAKGDEQHSGAEAATAEQQPATMLLFSAGAAPAPFRSVRLRPRRPDCFACSTAAGLTAESLASGALDYAAFCGGGVAAAAPAPPLLEVLAPAERVSAREYARRRGELEESRLPHVLVDVRDKAQFGICSIPGSINIPFSTFGGEASVARSDDEGGLPWLPRSLSREAPIYVICRLGNDSQVVARRLKESGLDNNGQRFVGDIYGGFRSWRKDVDTTWPDY